MVTRHLLLVEMQCFYEQFSLAVDDVICDQLDLGCSRNESLSTYCATSLFEFVMLRHGLLTIHANFTRKDFDDFIRTDYEDWCKQFIVFLCVIVCFFSFSQCTLCTI